MDFRTTSDAPTARERRAIDAIVGVPHSTWDGAGERSAADDHVAYGGFHRATERRHLLLPLLHAVQDAIGYVSHGALNYIATRIPVAPAEAFGVASFYDLIATEPQPPSVTRVCDDVVCMAGESAATIAGLEATIGPENTPNGDQMWVRSPCLGQCETGSGVFVQTTGDRPPPATQHSAPPSFDALEKARSIGPDAVRAEVVASGIRGRGGAAFPAGVKWNGVAQADGDPKYVICNADESEPGTFKDRWLIERDPYVLLEGIAIAAFAVGAHKAFIYIRGEYREAEQMVANAIDACQNRLGTEIEIRRGAGAYICGEETALFNSIEGFRGQPRQKPPFPTNAGVFGKPTLINNVETLAAIPGIVRDGGAAFASVGTAESHGRKLFCVSGSVHSPGVIDVPFGVSTRDLIARAGGVDGELQAVLVGGAAGTFLTDEELDTPLTFEDTHPAGISLGSGAIMVFNDSVDMSAITERIAAFFAHESCGLCLPCRSGTTQQLQIVGRMVAGAEHASDRGNLATVTSVMRDASVCGLGHTAGNAVESAIRIGLIGSDR